MSIPFDATAAQKRVEQFWSLSASFGMERNAYHNYLNEIVSDQARAWRCAIAMF